MKTRLFVFIIVTGLLFSCGPDPSTGAVSAVLPAPANLEYARVGESVSVELKWKDVSDSEVSFSILMRDTDNLSEIIQVATVPSGSTSWTISGKLTAGKSWYLGVRADAEDAECSSKTTWVVVYLEDMSKRPAARITSPVTATSTCLALSYDFINLEGLKKQEWGLCWSAEGEPDVECNHAAGPEIPADGAPVFQVIPNVKLDYGKDYKIRAYVTVSSGTYYSGAVNARLGAAPAPIKLDWKKEAFSGLPDGVEVYKTTSRLEGNAFQAWYAVADPSKVDFKVNVPSSAQTVDDQFTDDCLVLVNGGYFYNGRHTGLAVVDGVARGTIPDVRGSLRTGDAEYNELYHVTRGVFGVGYDGKPGVYWGGTAGDGQPLYFDMPLASVKGESKYPAVSMDCPCVPVSWAPSWALSAGPLLLMDGKIPFDFTETSRGKEYYLSNYEVIPYDIYGPGVSPDRTAAGYTADGKIILFVCDGRVSFSGGATLTQLARIMLGLGCVGAVNFDGGGSTAMVVKGEGHINDLSHVQTPANRPVVSTMGFYRK